MTSPVTRQTAPSLELSQPCKLQHGHNVWLLYKGLHGVILDVGILSVIGVYVEEPLSHFPALLSELAESWPLGWMPENSRLQCCTRKQSQHMRQRPGT